MCFHFEQIRLQEIPYHKSGNWANIRLMQLQFKGNIGDLPTSQFSLISQGKEVGFIQIRHRASHSKEVPPDFANHIYYEIYPEFRGQGYGKKILELGLIEARKIGLNRVVITTHKDNAPSKKVIKTNGGVLVDSCIIPMDGKTFLKYQINLDKKDPQ